jgi:DNA (cytosine-5)-methyltransferase 1
LSDEVVSLFAGAGGLSTGFALAGLKPMAGVEIDKDARTTYERTLEVPCHGLDLAITTPRELRATVGVGRHPLAIIGGPPCQGFSSAGARAEDDPRNRLIFNYLHIVGELRPRWFLFENVEGILTANSGTSIYQLAQQFIRLGYWIRIEKVNFAAFGAPQSRKRVIIVGNSLGLDFPFPSATHSYKSGKHNSLSALALSPSLSEALKGLGKPASRGDPGSPYPSKQPLNEYDRRMREGMKKGATVTHHVQPKVSESDLARINHLKPGQTMKDLPEELWHESYRRRAFRRVADGTPTERRGGAPAGLKRLRAEFNSLTITSAAPREFIHPSENRPLTLRECARLQSFPDRVEFAGNSSSVAQQIGNAVPPIGAEVLARSIALADGAVGSGRGVVTKRSRPALLGFHLTAAEGMSPALMRTHTLLHSLELDLFADREEQSLAAR